VFALSPFCDFIPLIWVSLFMVPNTQVVLPHELQKNAEIKSLQTKLCDNLADLFIKFLPYSIFHKSVEGFGLRRLRDL